MEDMQSQLKILRLKLNLCLACLLTLVAVVVCEAFRSHSDTIRVSRLEVIDKEGHIIVDMGYDRWTQGGAITLFGKDGQGRSWWRASPNGAHLIVSGGKDIKHLITAGISASDIPHSAAQSQVYVTSGDDAMGWLSCSHESGPDLHLYDRRGNTVAALPAHDKKK